MNKYAKLAAQAKSARRQWQMCGKKRAFITRQDALFKGQEVYSCQYCSMWHRSSSVSRLAARLRVRGVRTPRPKPQEG